MTHDYSRITYVTKYYDTLQGLRLVPLGIWFLLGAAGRLGWLPGFGSGRLDFTGLTLLGVALLYYLIGQYYNRHYGIVHQHKHRYEKTAGILMVVTLMAAILIDVYWQPAISFFSLTAGGFYTYTYFMAARPYRPYYLVIAALFFVISVLPLLLALPLNHALVGSGGILFYTVLGSSLIVTGILDHLMLAHTLQVTEEEPDHV